MTITLHTPTPTGLGEVVEAVATFQREGAPVQLHPGDLGWAWRFGSATLAADLRVWRRAGEIVAVGMVDSDDGVLRLAISPTVDKDAPFAARLVEDLTDPSVGVLPAGRATIEARAGLALRTRLVERGWVDDEPWTPLRRSLAGPVEEPGLRVEVLEADTRDEHLIRDRVAVTRAAFPNSTFTVDRWHTMAATPAYRRARCLVGYNTEGEAVAATTAWSAGADRPGLIEPLGAHPGHRGHGHGRAITLAAAATLRELGASSVTVCTPSTNVVAVAAYRSAGFDQLPDSPDLRRPD